MFIYRLQSDGPLPVHAGCSRSGDEVVRAQRSVRAARDGPPDVPQLLVEESPVH